MSVYETHKNGMVTWPTLYKMGSKGKEQQWDLAVVPHRNGDTIFQASVRVKHGQVGGKIQTSSVLIDKGKNVGRSNETTIMQQAVAEADAKYLKQLDKGYSPERGGGSMELKPMLAHSYEKDKDKVSFPAFVQPKLDGVRCIAHCVSGTRIDLYSRQGKKFTGLDHIRTALCAVMEAGDKWDGELYIHGVDFQKVISLVKREQEESAKLQYHVYDMVSDKRFADRTDYLYDAMAKLGTPMDFFLDENECHLPVVRLLPTKTVACHENVEMFHEQYVARGYEGVMLRWGEEPYKQGYRSHHLLKVKAFQDGEFEIVDVVDGVGKFSGRAIFVCKTVAGDQFQAVPKGRDELRQQYFEGRAALIGLPLTVRYFSMTDGDNPVPRFPVAISVRNYE